MLIKVCGSVTAVLCAVHCLSNALDPSLLSHLWAWNPVGGSFWVLNDLEGIEQ